MNWLIAFLLAAPPPSADMSLAPWFRGLKQNGSGASCCDISDCRVTPWRAAGSSIETQIEGRWYPVPEEKVLRQRDNPTGGAVTCYLKIEGQTYIMCFVRGPET